MAELTRRELLMAIPVVSVARALKADTSYIGRERWSLKMRLYVPRIYDNMSSRGYRKYQMQTISGEFVVSYVRDAEPEVVFCCLENATHKVNGTRVTYGVEPNGTVLWHGIGNNRTGKFTTRSVVLPIEAMPSYAIGPAPTEDNSLLLVLAGRGYSNGKRLKGQVAGQIGCGCAEYGHVSPTRIWGQSRVVDTAAVYGTWTAKRTA